MEHKVAGTLSHVVWIGGSPCAGKSTVAAALAERHASAR
jgi:adenylylsulfate kinase-like enzyme